MRISADFISPDLAFSILDRLRGHRIEIWTIFDDVYEGAILECDSGGITIDTTEFGFIDAAWRDLTHVRIL
jgi:hypothetical protein